MDYTWVELTRLMCFKHFHPHPFMILYYRDRKIERTNRTYTITKMEINTMMILHFHSTPRLSFVALIESLQIPSNNHMVPIIRCLLYFNSPFLYFFLYFFIPSYLTSSLPSLVSSFCLYSFFHPYSIP